MYSEIYKSRFQFQSLFILNCKRFASCSRLIQLFSLGYNEKKKPWDKEFYQCWKLGVFCFYLLPTFLVPWSRSQGDFNTLHTADIEQHLEYDQKNRSTDKRLHHICKVQFQQVQVYIEILLIVVSQISVLYFLGCHISK